MRMRIPILGIEDHYSDISIAGDATRASPGCFQDLPNVDLGAGVI